MYYKECIQSIQEFKKEQIEDKKNKSAIMQNIESKTISINNITLSNIAATLDITVNVKTIENVTNIENKTQINTKEIGSKSAVAKDKKPFIAPSMEISH